MELAMKGDEEARKQVSDEAEVKTILEDDGLKTPRDWFVSNRTRNHKGKPTVEITPGETSNVCEKYQLGRRQNYLTSIS